MSPAEVMFVVATTGSMDPYYMPQVIEFISNLTQSLPINGGQIRLGVMTYSLEPYVDISLGQYQRTADIVDALNDLTYHGNRSVVTLISTILVIPSRLHFKINRRRKSNTICYLPSNLWSHLLAKFYFLIKLLFIYILGARIIITSLCICTN